MWRTCRVDSRTLTVCRDSWCMMLGYMDASWLTQGTQQTSCQARPREVILFLAYITVQLLVQVLSNNSSMDEKLYINPNTVSLKRKHSLDSNRCSPVHRRTRSCVSDLAAGWVGAPAYVVFCRPGCCGTFGSGGCPCRWAGLSC